MLAASIALAALAVLLAWPVPVLLSRAAWPSRAPAAALALWQAIALAGGLSMIGALLTFGLIPFGDDLLDSAFGFAAFVSGAGTATPFEAWHVFALAGAVLLGGHLLLNLGLTVVRAERQRRRHARLIALLSEPMAGGDRLIDDPAPVAYCLPGPLRSITVFSAGLLQLLEADELAAVVAHERAHVEQRHDVVLVLFRAWYASLPWFPIAYRAQREVGALVEMLADDRARRVVDDAVLARAIALVGSASPAEQTTLLGDAEPGSPDLIRDRVMRLGAPVSGPAVRAAALTAAAALLAVPTALLLGPGIAGLVT
ncbi:MAG TPA: M56 family metallopeptidase [Rhodoglobus sp.]|nr:M56 family metallopeptidase [Rhodoglobus sp.]